MVEKDYFYKITGPNNVPPLQIQAVKRANFLEYKSELSIFSTVEPIGKTGIICTIGPQCKEVEVIEEMIRNGMNVARINAASDSIETCTQYMENVRKAVANINEAEEMSITVSMVFELKGVEIHLGSIHGDESLDLKVGSLIRLTTDKTYMDKGSSMVMYIDFESVSRLVNSGDMIYVDSARIKLKVRDIQGNQILCEVTQGGILGNKMEVHIPSIQQDVPTLTDKDKLDLAFAANNDVDAIIVSLVKDPGVIKEVYSLMGEKGKDILVLAKIESLVAMDEFDYIVHEFDGIVIGRKKLGLDLPLEKLFICQKSLIAKCKKSFKPVICTFEILNSMVEDIRPTNAEASDIANIILDGADCIGLVRETAIGKYPAEAVRIAANICLEAEAAIWQTNFSEEVNKQALILNDVTLIVAIASVDSARRCQAKGIVVLTTSGQSAFMISSLKPWCPILAITRNIKTARKCHLFRAVVPIFYNQPRNANWEEDALERCEYGIEYGKKMGVLKPGDPVIIIKGWKSGSGTTNTMLIYFVAHNRTILVENQIEHPPEVD